MSFGEIAPQESEKNVLAMNAEIIDTLKEVGLVDSVNGLLPEDYPAIVNRINIIKKSHPVPSEVLISLAYVDRMIAVQKERGNIDAENKLVSKIDNDLVSTLISEPAPQDLSHNEEFLGTVVKLATTYYSKGTYVAFSDALFDALKNRIEQIKPEIDGRIDGEENVILGKDVDEEEVKK